MLLKKNYFTSVEKEQLELEETQRNKQDIWKKNMDDKNSPKPAKKQTDGNPCFIVNYAP